MANLERDLYEEMAKYPIISPHGHVDANVLANNENWEDAVDLLIRPDHYVTRMLYSQGISYEELKKSGIEVWKIFHSNWKLFAGTPSRLWLNEIFSSLFDIEDFAEISAEKSYAKINAILILSPAWKKVTPRFVERIMRAHSKRQLNLRHTESISVTHASPIARANET